MRFVNDPQKDPINHYDINDEIRANIKVFKLIINRFIVFYFVAKKRFNICFFLVCNSS